jgi:alkaline phosphatase D
VAAGDLTSDSVVLWTRTPSAASVTAELAASDTFENLTALPAAPATAATDFTVKVVATGLQPGTQYYYRFKVGSTVSPAGSFKTPYATDQDAAVTFAFSGDADWKWKPYPLLNSLIQEKLDFFPVPGRSDLRNNRYEGPNICRRPGRLSLEVPRKPRTAGWRTRQ